MASYGVLLTAERKYPFEPHYTTVTTYSVSKPPGVRKKRTYQETTVNPVVKPACKRSRRELDLTTLPYPDFNFRPKFSLLVVGPTQSGKTHFVQQILENDRKSCMRKRESAGFCGAILNGRRVMMHLKSYSKKK